MCSLEQKRNVMYVMNVKRKKMNVKIKEILSENNNIVTELNAILSIT